jgi:hypothetical protein
MQGERAVFFWLSHISSVGYPKADESCCSLSIFKEADENYFDRRKRTVFL